jgi:predicted nucleotidyltransferase component of viral defense system
MARTYTSAGAFRKALEERLKSESRARQMDVNRLRRQVSFDRLLARLFRAETVPWVLKGGYALELRFKAARSTIDIDLTLQRVVGALDNDSAARAVREMLQAAAAVSLDGWFEYTIGPPISDLTAAPYGGARYSIETRMDGRIFAKFHLDAGIGDVVIQPLETIECFDWLNFAGIQQPKVRVISCEQQFAEKIHAYTLPRSSTNSRVKDLVDLLLLSRDNQVDKLRSLNALRVTFERRNTHALPASLIAPPEEWRIPFEALAADCGVKIGLLEAFEELLQFCREVLATGTEK